MNTISQSSDMAAFYAELLQFVEKEFSEQRRRYREIVSQPLHKRIALGKCVPGLRFERQTKAGHYRFRCTENLSDFREGDSVSLHRGDPLLSEHSFVWAGDGLLPTGDEFIDFHAGKSPSSSAFNPNCEFTVDESFLDLEKLVRQALDELAGSERGRERILPLLMNTAPEDEVDSGVYEAAEQTAAKEGFNDSQQEAIAEGVAAGWCSLIQGPPGTGKTRVLANIVKQRVQDGQRVLVSAFTHRAIHQALNAIRTAIPEFDRVAKIGQPITDPGLAVPQYESFADSPFKDEEGAYVIGATPFTARGRRLAGVEFDSLVVDEASQMTLPLAIMAMLSADTYVMIGDPKQLPPVVQSVPNWEAASLSIFNRLEMNRNRVLLDISYRMNRQITSWVGEQFYSGELSAADSCASRSLAVAGVPPEQQWLADVLDPDRSLVWLTTAAANTRHYSIEEASLVMQVVLALLRGGHSPHEIGVVTPFRRQARTIRRRLRQNPGIHDDFSNAIIIDTVERMQGQEREVIIVSTAASDAGFIAHLQEFLYLPARLNVAVSRAKTKVIVMASDNLLNTESADPEIQEAVSLWRSLKMAAFTLRM